MIGKPLRRVEDPRFLTGRGRFIDDLSLPGMLHMAVVRSIYPRARFRVLPRKGGGDNAGQFED